MREASGSCLFRLAEVGLLVDQSLSPFLKKSRGRVIEFWVHFKKTMRSGQACNRFIGASSCVRQSFGYCFRTILTRGVFERCKTARSIIKQNADLVGLREEVKNKTLKLPGLCTCFCSLQSLMQQRGLGSAGELH